MKPLFLALLLLFGLFIGAITTAVYTEDMRNMMLERCQKENNVYRCEFVVIPVEPDE